MVFPIVDVITSIGPTQGDGLGNQWKVVGYKIWLSYDNDKVIFGNLWPWLGYWT
jgi:hypothetical protein